MILADKIIINRKRLNLTQEALAEEINVSRQAVSKWEGAQSIPEMEKIILLSNLFGVSVDYLIRDEIEDIEYLDSEQFSKTKRLSVEEVNTFLEKSMRSSSYVSLGVMLCILSPVMLILLT
ncbi:MAG: helix-turn-helix transcriptional regulator, partial [Tissierellaceae bacterium]